jgi:hypothetical protein
MLKNGYVLYDELFHYLNSKKQYKSKKTKQSTRYETNLPNNASVANM